MRPIDADALLKHVQCRLHFDDVISKTIDKCVEITRRLISDAPTIEAELVRHGRWVGKRCNHKPCRIKKPEKWLTYKCSVCGYSNGRKQSNYCPNCGAKMDGGGDDDQA